MAIMKARFKIAAEASPTTVKTTIHMVKTIQLVGRDEIYEFPAEFQSLTEYHPDLAKLPITKGVVNSIKMRHSYRSFTVSLSTELQKVYMDTEQNLVFMNEYLAEITEQKSTHNEITQEGTGGNTT
jgi:hypothetical protein